MVRILPVQEWLFCASIFQVHYKLSSINSKFDIIMTTTKENCHLSLVFFQNWGKSSQIAKSRFFLFLSRLFCSKTWFMLSLCFSVYHFQTQKTNPRRCAYTARVELWFPSLYCCLMMGTERLPHCNNKASLAKTSTHYANGISCKLRYKLRCWKELNFVFSC